MLLFALKAVWFALCALGTVATWFVLWFLGKATNTYWLPILYCVGLTILEGMFCLGMIYHMDPYQMPRSFCLAQIFTISFSALLLTGVCLTVILAVSTAVIWPYSTDASPQSALRWKWGYLVPLLVIPVTFASAQLALVIKYDAYSPSDNIHCDVTGPYLWLALLGYAGMPALESLPCFAINIVAVFRVHSMYKSHQRTGAESKSSSPESCKKDADQTQTHSQGTAEPRPPSSPYSSSTISRSSRDLDLDLEAPTWTPPSPAVMSTHSSSFAKIGRAPPTPQFRPVVSPPPLSLRYSYSSQSQSRSPVRGPGSSHASSSSRERYSSAPRARPWSGAESFELHRKDGIDGSDGISVVDAYESTAALTRHWPGVGAGAFAFVPRTEAVQEDWNMEKEEIAGDYIDITQEPIAVSWDELSQPQTPPDAQASFMSLIWRLVLFFLFFFLVQILVTLSTIIDVSRGSHALTPFGTQHVALLLAAWGPSVIFAHAPGIRVRLIGLFWRS
ncbi:hypothetical protein FIBSPDRAFT_1045214 [Athelia psychrophila]|uniref:Family A G protein-coupled receptor-like protein n=1 Tax=Athelia psychrophila TaxID=1759441 RepID=A0A166IMI8_9AGAM|nr:hypothetical protein FIBSPDRAFT_1045214 [Fibularhizoctonia sp. CBS 109695]